MSLAERLQLLAQYGGPENYDPRMKPVPGMGFDPRITYGTIERPGGARKLMTPQDAVDNDPSRHPPFVAR